MKVDRRSFMVLLGLTPLVKWVKVRTVPVPSYLHAHLPECQRWTPYVKPRLNGRIIEDAIWADTKSGLVCRFAKDENGRLYVENPGDPEHATLAREVLAGKVEWEWVGPPTHATRLRGLAHD